MKTNAFDKIIGYENIKEELMQITDVLTNPDVYSKLGVAPPAGLLLYGEPGLGKTLMAQCLINACGRYTVTCRKDKPDGDFTKHIKNCFKKAAENAPSILLLDDLDKFSNSDDRRCDTEEYVTVQSCIDEVKGKNVFVLATVNDIRKLPRSLYRAGRFDRIIKITSPTGEDAAKLINYYLSKKKFRVEPDPQFIADVLGGCSCAKLETVINEAGIYAGAERSDLITTEHFVRACMYVVFDVHENCFSANMDLCKNLNNANSRSAQVIYHEAGHAVVSEVLNPGSVTIVSVLGGERSVGGMTVYSDHNSNNKDPLIIRKQRIISGLGGIAGVECKFGISNCGSSEDLNIVYQNINKLVGDECVCGFSNYSYGFDDSEHKKHELEVIAASQMEKYYRKAKEIITQNKELFEAVARALAEKSTITKMDIQKIKKRLAGQTAA